jgi:deazaflavin-dependent oxidoreductase (nitroreductase family)
VSSSEHQPDYRAPSAFDRKVINPAIAALSRLGLSFAGSRILEVRGRRTGQARRNPVNPLVVDGRRYLVAPRGQTEWVRNLRAAGEGELLLGRRRERFRASEVADAQKLPILREYLRRWKWEVGQFFDGVGPDAPDAELARIAPRHPIFLLES